MKKISLSGPKTEGALSVEGALYDRVSRRRFGPGSLDLAQVGQLLWAAGGLGVKGSAGVSRTAPSAGATYPLELYLVAGRVEGAEAGLYHYDYRAHSLTLLAEGDLRIPLAGAALGQEMLAEAPASLVMVAHYERTTGRYGERGYRYVHMDTGYMSQNIYLQAEALSMATVAVGAFDDIEVSKVLGVEGAPLMIMPIGWRQ